MVAAKPCKDCVAEGITTRRSANKPGPRCASHWRIEVKRRDEAAHELTVQKKYGLSKGEYEALYLFQGGRCALCKRATGAARRLSVDHDHRTGEVRGLLCRPCNSLLGHARDEEAMFLRTIGYLRNPPYKQMGSS